jgi:hypothetical protein
MYQGLIEFDNTTEVYDNRGCVLEIISVECTNCLKFDDIACYTPLPYCHRQIT